MRVLDHNIVHNISLHFGTKLLVPPFSHYVCSPQALFDSILGGLLARVRDHNGRVQEAACSGLAEVMEHAGHCTNGEILTPRFKVRTCINRH